MARLQVILCQPSLEYPSFVSLWAMLSNAEQDDNSHRVVQMVFLEKETSCMVVQIVELKPLYFWRVNNECKTIDRFDYLI